MMIYNIKYFRNYINSMVLRRANDYVKKKKISQFEYTDDGKVSAIVKGSREYNVSFNISENGDISLRKCTCPYEWGGDCKHIAAVLIVTEKEYERRKVTVTKGSGIIGRLIDSYTSAAVEAETVKSEDRLAHIVPYVTTDKSNVRFRLYIGREKLYSINSIQKLHNLFSGNERLKYGKFFDFKHDYSLIDEKSNKVFELALANYSTEEFFSKDEKSFRLFGKWVDRFFDIYRDSYVNIDDTECFVTYGEPEIGFKVSEADDDRYSISAVGDYQLIGKGKRGVFLDKRLHKVYMASAAYTAAVYDLYSACKNHGKLVIEKEDMPAFYTAVIKRVRDHAKVERAEIFDSFVPPELISRLYIDCGKDNETLGRLIFCYGDNDYPYNIDSDAPVNPFCDIIGEKIAADLVHKFFRDNPDEEDTEHSFVIDTDEALSRLLSDGIEVLNSSMEVYASDSFRRKTSRPALKPVLSINPGKGELFLNISDDNYTIDEMYEILEAYRSGAKYHRLINGSFITMNQSVADLDELTKALNITDKQFLKNNLHIPMYRMMYLDSLKKNESFGINRSEEFKKAIRKYRSNLEGTDNTQVPTSLDGRMRDYQHYGYRWLKALSIMGFGGILADDMGLGKTLQSIALLLDDKENSKEHRLNLVVAPASLTLNWEQEIEKFAPELRCLTVIGTAQQREKLLSEAEKYDVIITSYSSISRDIALYEDMHFHLHFIDEAQYIKNHTTQNSKAVKAINSDIRFALTGTPVENNLAEFWSIFDFVLPGYLFNYNHFKKTFETPIVAHRDESAIKSLQNTISPFILRRLKKEVLPELPEKIETVLVSRMEPEQRKIYAANAKRLKVMLQKNGDNKSENTKALAQLIKLLIICCDPHIEYHEQYKGSSAKLDQAIDLIDNCVHSGHKLLFFSHFVSVFPSVEKRLDELGITYYELTGDTKPSERIRMQNEFNNNDVKVFLISLKAGGNGLNLTGADIVIHFEPWWNVSAENQASDRAYRFGQKNNVQVYKLVAEDTIEQSIIRMQEAKKELNDIVVGGNINIFNMSADQIESLLDGSSN